MQAPSGHDWHAQPGQQSLQHLNSSAQGLDSSDAAQRLSEHGPNLLPQPQANGPFKRFVLQFHNLLIYVLLGACKLTLLLGEWLDSAVIFAVVLINALVGFVQEGKAQHAMLAIQQMLSLESRVRRNGQEHSIAAE